MGAKCCGSFLMDFGFDDEKQLYLTNVPYGKFPFSVSCRISCFSFRRALISVHVLSNKSYHSRTFELIFHIGGGCGGVYTVLL